MTHRISLRSLALVYALSVFAGCGDDGNPTLSDEVPTVTVMTWNVYIGGNVQTAFTTLDNPCLLYTTDAAADS